MKYTFFLAACSLASGLAAAAPPFPLTAARSIDGSGYAGGGAAVTPLHRIAPADYPDSGSGELIYEEPLATNPRDISNLIAAQPAPRLNARSLSDFVWTWGQFLDHDLDLTLTNPANGIADIPVVEDDDVLAPGPILFDRSDFDPSTGTPGNPRQQINAITAFIDASNVYGSDIIRADALRTFAGGRLRTSAGNLLPFNDLGLPNAGGPDPSLFLAGDVRANEQIGLTAMHTLFVREHNRLALKIARVFQDASDEQIYQLARKIVGAEMQIITYEEFLPAVLGPHAPALDDYAGFNPSVDPSIVNEFSTAAYRFGHSMLSPSLLLADKQGPVGSLSLADAFFNPSFLVDTPGNVNFLLKGFAVQQAQEVDNQIVDEVRNFLFGPPGAGGLDLASLNIQRGRDHGLPGYNAVRSAYGLIPASDFADISSDPLVQDALDVLYGSVDEIDAWVGGLAEDHLPDASVGELITTVLVYQFTALRDGDPFFFLNDPDFDAEALRSVIRLEDVTLAEVIRRNTSIKHLQDNVFFIP